MSTTTLSVRPAPVPASAPAAGDVLDRAAAAVEARRRAEVEVLEAVLEWAHAHTVTSGSDGARDAADVAGWRPEVIHSLFGDRALPIAGSGTPLVAEFAVMELCAALDLSHEATTALVGDVLDLAHRLPRLWALVRTRVVPVRLGREAAGVSRDLTLDAAGHADRLLAWQPARLNPHRIGVLVHEARLYADPDRAVADHDEALASRRVEVDHDAGPPGTGEVHMRLDTADLVAFDHTVSTMAATMRALGHHGDLDVRRAHAVGVLADPQRALELLTAPTLPPALAEDSPELVVAEDVAHAPANPFRRPTLDPAYSLENVSGEGSGEVVLVFHVTDRDLLDHTLDGSRDRHGVARSPKLGPVLVGRLRSWLLTAGKVTITPVVDLDPAAHPPVDAHDPPERMAAMVRHRDQTCVYPACRQSSERSDLDHIDAYLPPDQGGPPGQTRPDNLAPLCRRHHRAKTFGDFTYRRLPDGSYRWTLPSGRTVTTDPPTPRPRPEPRP